MAPRPHSRGFPRRKNDPLHRSRITEVDKIGVDAAVVRLRAKGARI